MISGKSPASRCFKERGWLSPSHGGTIRPPLFTEYALPDNCRNCSLEGDS